MNNKTYDIIKNTALLAAPIIVFLSALVTIWNIPHGAEITATLAAVDSLLGGVVVVTKKIYDKKQGDGENE